jgi:hypothetical protein
VYLPANDPATVTLGFCRSRGIFSRAIEWFGAGGYSHVTSLLPDREHVIDARLNGGVQKRNVGYLSGTPIDWIDITCAVSESTKFYEFLHKQIGKKYDIEGIVDFALGLTQPFRWTHPTSAWFCDELAAAALIDAGIARRPWQVLTRLTPGACGFMVSQLDWQKSKFSLRRVL